MTPELSTPQAEPLHAVVQTVLTTLQQAGLNEGILHPSRKTRILVAYSGGADSTVLLHALCQLRQHYPLEVVAAFYNHGWRGTPAPELQRIHKNCQAFHVPLVLIPQDKRVPKTETAARQVRYERLISLAQNMNAQALVTAHHQDDQVETILFRILRGTGLAGLSGIPSRMTFGQQQFPVLRPLLGLSQETLLKYIEQHELYFFEDPSNQDTAFSRNLIRQQILPNLEQHFPAVRANLLKLQDIAAGDQSIVDANITELSASVICPTIAWPFTGETTPKESKSSIDVEAFNPMGRAQKRQILRRFLGQVRFSKTPLPLSGSYFEVDYDLIETCIDFLAGTHRTAKSDSAWCSLPSNQPHQKYFLSLYQGMASVILLSNADNKLTHPVLEVSLPDLETEKTVVSYPSLNLALTVEALTHEQQVAAHQQLKKRPPNPQSLDVWVDFSNFTKTTFALRTRQVGDTLIPMGMDIPVKFKRYLINRGVPKFYRNELPLLTNDSSVLWVPGIGISNSLRINKLPTHRLRLVPLSSLPQPQISQEDPEPATAS